MTASRVICSASHFATSSFFRRQARCSAVSPPCRQSKQQLVRRATVEQHFKQAPCVRRVKHDHCLKATSNINNCTLIKIMICNLRRLLDRHDDDIQQGHSCREHLLGGLNCTRDKYPSFKLASAPCSTNTAPAHVDVPLFSSQHNSRVSRLTKR